MSDNNTNKRGTGNNSTPPPPNRNDKAPSNETNSSQNGPSLASRIQNSASGLARNALFPSAPSADAAQLLNSSDGSKAAPSASGSSSALAAAQQYNETIGPSSSSTRDPSSTGQAATFRSPSTSTSTVPQGGFQLPALSEDEFQQSYGDAHAHAPAFDPVNSIPEHELLPGSRPGKGKAKVSDPYTTTQLSQPSADPDGTAVINLLSNPSFDPEHPAPDLTFDIPETDLQSLTDSELQMIDSFRRRDAQHSPHPPAQTPHRRLTTHSLIPDINSVLDGLPAGGAVTDTASLRDNVLASLPGAGDWVALEDKYQDEVWGYLRPTLEAARQEMEAKNADEAGGQGEGGGEEGPAVRRLRMILKHMQV